MHGVVVYWVLIFGAGLLVADSKNRDESECAIRMNTYDDYKIFKLNDIDLPMKTVLVHVLENSQEECSLDMKKMIQSIRLPASNNTLGFVIHCMKPKRIHIKEGTSQRLDHVIASFQIANCGFGVQDWNTLSAAFDTRVLLVMDNFFPTQQPSNVTFSECSALTKIGSFIFHYITIPNEEKRNFFHMFDCAEVFTSMAEVIFQNMSWTELPDSMIDKFPNLQLLDLSNNEFSEPPAIFPWSNNTFHLPRNLSRTTYMDSHYTRPFEIQIPADTYRRELNLNFNKIKNLNNVSFHGLLHRLSLKGNGLKIIGNDTFNKVEGLQSLDLSNNLIVQIPCAVFSNLSHLRMLNLKLNNLTEIHNCLFLDLISLRKMNLANNKITSIDSKAFVHMANLSVLNLENNKLTHLTPDAFPLESVHLKELYLQGNPITVLPEFVFWFRKIELVNLASTHISMNDFTAYLTNMDRNRVLQSLVVSASTSDLSDLLVRRTTLRKIDLSSSKIDNLYLRNNASDKIKTLLKILLLHYEFILKDNPLVCDCRIIQLQSIVNELRKQNIISFKDYYFSEWTCQSPEESLGRQLMSVEAEETYCSVDIENCPIECKCFKRSLNNNIIVDCRHLELKKIHSVFPENVSLELWYGGNNITRIETNTSLPYVIYFDLSFNRLQELPKEMLRSMKNIKTLRLHSNLLSYLPQILKKLPLEDITISSNPLQCDCNSLWLKVWLKENQYIISDWNKVSCTIHSTESGHTVIDVPDDQFVCEESIPSTSFQTLIIAGTTLLVILFIACIFGYTYRLECKVMMFVYFGIHPFDKDVEGKDTEHIDCVIVHDGRDTDFVMQSIVKCLEDEAYNYVICDMERDFVLGFSLQENISKTVKHSKRIIFLLSNNWNPSSEGFAVAWGIAKEKIKETKSNFGILVTHEISHKSIENESIQRFIKHGRFVDSSDKLFLKKVMYYMPGCEREIRRETNSFTSIPESFHRKEIARCFLSNGLNACEKDTYAVRADTGLKHAFISYANEDIDYVLKHIQPFLEEKGFDLIIPDRDFIPGASKEENILQAIQSCRKTILVLSSFHCKDEWTLFTFRAAYEKSLREQYNHLLVLMIEDVQQACIDEEMRHYLHKYICLKRSDKWFENKLLNGMSVVKYKESIVRLPSSSNEEYIQSCITSSEIDINIDEEVTKL